jgi:hypothetical protein
LRPIEPIRPSVFHDICLPSQCFTPKTSLQPVELQSFPSVPPIPLRRKALHRAGAGASRIPPRVGLGVTWRGLYNVYTPLLHFWSLWNVLLADAGRKRSLKSPVSCPSVRPDSSGALRPCLDALPCPWRCVVVPFPCLRRLGVLGGVRNVAGWLCGRLGG